MKTAPLEELPATFRLLGEVNRRSLNSWLDVFIKVLAPVKPSAKTKILCTIQRQRPFDVRVARFVRFSKVIKMGR